MIAVIGAGLSGLSVARSLQQEGIPFRVLEQSSRPGGLSGQYRSGGIDYDYGGHYFHFPPGSSLKEELLNLVPFSSHQRRSFTLLFQRLIPFPLQYHLAALPRSIRRPVFQELMGKRKPVMDNLGDYLVSVFGPRLYRHFFRPFLSKYYQVDPHTLAAGQEQGSIPVPDPDEIRAGYQGDQFHRTGYNPVFYYPRKELKHFVRKYAAPVRSRITFCRKVEKIDVVNRRFITRRGSHPYSILVNTAPLNQLLRMIIPRDRIPGGIHLSHVSTRIVNMTLKEKKRDFHWIYLPHPAVPFYRCGYYAQSPPVRCYLEESLSPRTPPGRCGSEAVHVLRELGMIEDRKEILEINSRFIPVSYIRFDHHWKASVEKAHRWLRSKGIHSIGRFGAWRYSSMSGDIALARKTAWEISHEPN